MHMMAAALLSVAFLQAQATAEPGSASPAATPAPPAAEVAPPAAAAPLTAAFAIEPGARLPLSASAEVVVDPAAAFELELAARLVDARLVLVDGRGDLVPATETREIGTATRLSLRPSAPLVPGSRYALRVDGAAQRELLDEAGRAFTPVTLPILAAGTPPPPEPKRPAKKKRRR